MNRILVVAIAAIAVLATVEWAPVARAADTVTYEILSDSVSVLAGVEYRDVSGKHLLPGVTLPWRITVPVPDTLSPTARGAELRADWRPNFRTAATVGRVLQGQFVTVRILFLDEVVCESTLDVGNATCYGSVPHRPDTNSSYDRSPLFPEVGNAP